MEILKKVLNSFILFFIAEVAIGVLLLIDPHIFTNTISYILGGVLLAFGLLNLIAYFRAEQVFGYLLKTVVMCAAGIFIITRPSFIFNVLAVIFGLYLLTDGISSLRGALVMKSYGADKWAGSLIMAILTIVLGIVLIVNPLASTEIAITALGIALVASGIFSIYNGAVTKRYIKRMAKNAIQKADPQRNDDYIDID